MVVIFFNLGLVLAFILLVSIVFINASTKFVLAILGVTCILFLIKDIIQDLYFALYKYKNNVLIVIISFALDIARIAFFYKLIHHFAAGTARATGLSTFGWMLGYVISIEDITKWLENKKQIEISALKFYLLGLVIL